jgi:hypothetical protein
VPACLKYAGGFLLIGDFMLYLTDEELVKDKDQSVLTPVITRQERIALCNSCPEKGTSVGFDICNKCGCILGFKTFFKLSSCPLNKWVIPEDQLPRA